MDWLRFIEFLLALAAFGVVAWGGILWYRAQQAHAEEDRSKVVNKELEQLADTRGKRIDDLEESLEIEKKERRQDAQAFREELAELRGQVEALRSLKAEEIADLVVSKQRHPDPEEIADIVASKLKG